MLKINCQKCGVEVETKALNLKFCKECKILDRRERDKVYREKYKDKRKAHYTEYRKTHKEEIAERMKDYNKIYKESHTEERKEYRKNKKENDETYKIEQSIRSKIHTFLRSKDKKKYSDFVGSNILDYKKWLESNFTSKMNWDNYGILWHIDHVIPSCIFDFLNEDEILFCFNWKNTRPLLADINVSRKYSYKDILIHELKTIFYITDKQNENLTNINYGVSNLPIQVRNNLNDLINC